MALKGLSKDKAKAAKKHNQTVLLNTKYNKEPKSRPDRSAKPSQEQ